MAFNYEYPYTDAQRYNDDWLINKVKELAMDWIKTSGEWTETQEAWEEFKLYITNYFNNLDVQEEINEKLEAMKADGSLFDIIQPLFDEYQQAINVLSARMDTFTALGDGATTGDAELADIRVDYTGHTWPNAGDAVRGITSQLSSEIAEIVQDNELDYFSLFNRALKNTYKGFYNASTSNINKVGGYNFIVLPVNAGDVITVNLKSGESRVAQFETFNYEENNMSIASESFITLVGSDIVNIVIKETAKYFYIMTLYNNVVSDFDIFLNGMKAPIGVKKYVDSKIRELPKRISILGDSYSTYKGYLTPTEFNETAFYGSAIETDIESVEDTYWYKLFKNDGYMFEVNNSRTSATVCTTGYDGTDSTETAFCTRVKELGRPDIIIIYGGTNDSWANSPIGEYKYNDFETADLANFRGAYAYTVNYALMHNPNADIICVYANYMSEEIKNSIETITNHYGVKCVNVGYIPTPYNGHPNKEGMEKIYNALKPYLS